MRRSPRRCAVALVAGAGLALTTGCGGDGLPRELTPGQRADLHTLIGQARTAAGAGDLAATNAALVRLKARVRTLRENGALDGEDAALLLKHAALAELKAGATIRAPVAPPAPPTPPPAPDPAIEPPAAVTPPPAATQAPGKAKKKPKGDGRRKGAKQDD